MLTGTMALASKTLMVTPPSSTLIVASSPPASKPMRYSLLTMKDYMATLMVLVEEEIGIDF